MKETYIRTEQVQEVIKDIKLTVNAWKLLFAIDGETELEKLNFILGLNEEEVKSCVQELSDSNLIEKTGEEESLEPAIEEGLPEKPEIVDEVIQEPDVSDEEISLAEEVEGQKVADEVDIGVETEMEEPELGEDDLEKLIAESHVEEMPELAMDTVEEDIKTDGGEGTEEVALDDLVSQIVEEDDDLSSEDESEKELEELLAEGDLGEKPEEQPEMSKQEDELDESELFADLEKDIQDFMLDEDLGVEGDEPEEVETQVKTTKEAGHELDSLGELDFEDIAVQEEPEAPVEKETETVIDADRKTVLVVDDSVVIRKMIEIALENDPFNVIAAPTGKEALSKVDEENISVIILDLILPDLNGLDVLKAVKASSDIPVIILTGKDAPKEIQKAKEQGADDFLTKPFKDEDLVSKVKALSA